MVIDISHGIAFGMCHVGYMGIPHDHEVYLFGYVIYVLDHAGENQIYVIHGVILPSVGA